MERIHLWCTGNYIEKTGHGLLMNVVSQQLPGGTDEYHKKPATIFGFWVENCTPEFLSAAFGVCCYCIYLATLLRVATNEKRKWLWMNCRKYAMTNVRVDSLRFKPPVSRYGTEVYTLTMKTYKVTFFRLRMLSLWHLCVWTYNSGTIWPTYVMRHVIPPCRNSILCRQYYQHIGHPNFEDCCG